MASILETMGGGTGPAAKLDAEATDASRTRKPPRKKKPLPEASVASVTENRLVLPFKEAGGQNPPARSPQQVEPETTRVPGQKSKSVLKGDQARKAK